MVVPKPAPKRHAPPGVTHEDQTTWHVVPAKSEARDLAHRCGKGHHLWARSRPSLFAARQRDEEGDMKKVSGRQCSLWKTSPPADLFDISREKLGSCERGLFGREVSGVGHQVAQSLAYSGINLGDGRGPHPRAWVFDRSPR